MLIESIRGYAKQLQEIQAREITTKKMQRNMGEEQEEELTGVLHGGGGVTVSLQRRSYLPE
jgi:hypothetical protein